MSSPKATNEKSKVIGEYHSRILDIIKAWLPVVTVVCGALWGLYQYLDTVRTAEANRLEQQKTADRQRNDQAREAEQARQFQLKRDTETRRIEAQKPFLELQLKTYLQATALLGKLILFDTTSPQYKTARNDFEALYWSELNLVQDENVLSVANTLRHALEKNEEKPNSDTQADVKLAASELTLAIRKSIRSGWYGVAPIEAQ